MHRSLQVHPWYHKCVITMHGVFKDGLEIGLYYQLQSEMVLPPTIRLLPDYLRLHSLLHLLVCLLIHSFVVEKFPLASGMCSI